MSQISLPTAAMLIFALSPVIALPLAAQETAVKLAPDAAGKRQHSRAAGIKWVPIPGGTFMMGLDDGAPAEKPRHEVRVKAFSVAKTEVTFGQYKACVKAGA